MIMSPQHVASKENKFESDIPQIALMVNKHLEDVGFPFPGYDTKLDLMVRLLSRSLVDVELSEVSTIGRRTSEPKQKNIKLVEFGNRKS